MRSAQGCIQELSGGRRRVIVEMPRDPITGKRRHLSRVVRGSRKEAERVMHELLVRAGCEEVISTDTLREYIEGEYLPYVRANRKASTAEGYEARLRLYVLPQLGSVCLKDLTTARVRTWLSRLTCTDAAKVEAYKVLRQVCRRAMYDDKLAFDPTARVEKPKSARYEPTVLDVEQVRVYLDHFTGHPMEPAVLLALGGGLRRGEICALTVDDIDWATGAVRVSKATITTKAGTHEGTPKNGKAHTVHLPPSILVRLREIAPAHGHVLQHTDGEPYKPHSITQAYERHRASLPEGVPRIPLKNLRHTSLTLAYDSGARITDVRYRADHSSQAVTERYYLRPKQSRDIEIADAMDKFLRATPCNNSGEIRVHRVDPSKVEVF